MKKLGTELLSQAMDKFDAVEEALNAGEKVEISRDQNGRVSIETENGTYLFADASEIMELPERFPDLPLPAVPR